MDYKKKYEEALDRAKGMFEQGMMPERIEYIFPELKESEDERIRKELYNFIQINSPREVAEKYISWLEKQGEQKTADKIEPKFKVGDWIRHNIAHFNFKVVSIGYAGYEVINSNNCKHSISLDAEQNYHLWTIQDAKDGDVLETEGFVFIFKEIREDKGIGYFCANEKELHEGDDDTFHIANPNSLMGSINNGFTHYTPATKEQRDVLFQKMHEAGYDWDAEKKELKKIEQKPAWSEEDEDYFDAIITKLEITQEDAALTDNQMEFLKSLKNRVQPQPQQQWSEEDECCRRQLIIFCENCMVQDSNSKKCADWLKSLRPHWKPSEEQVEALKKNIEYVNVNNTKPLLEGLLKQLKKLRDEK